MEERPPDPADPYRPRDFQPPPSPPPPPATPSWEVPYGGGPPPTEAGPDPIPWEQPGLGFFAGFYETLRLLATKPRRAYQRVAATRAWMRPLGFALLVGWPGILAGTFWEITFQSQMEQWLPWLKDQGFERTPPIVAIGIALAAPVWFPVFLFVAAAFQHLFLWMVGGAKSGFVQTFRVMCYAQISALGGFLPMCGSLLAAVWHIVLQVIGLSAVHKIGVGRALLALLLPLLICCGCIAILFSMFGAAWLAGLKGSP